MKTIFQITTLSFLIISFLFISRADAFPELIRHGYVNCLTCHSAPTGGGAINDYGRTFSGEGLSTWSRKNEESLFHGLVKRSRIPKWLSIGGDYRGLQTYHENANVKEGHWYNMQADVEAAVHFKKVTLDMAYGRFQLANEEPRPKSRRFFAMYNFTDEWMVRAGRFIPAYGVNLPDHVISTRDPIGMGQGSERYNVEASFINDTWNFILTGSKGPVEQPDNSQESAVIAQAAYSFHDTYKIGMNAWSGSSDATSRQMVGMFLNFGFNDDWCWLSELDSVTTTTKSSSTTQTGLFSYNRLGWEIHRGVNLLATLEYWKTNASDDRTTTERYGIGTQLFPRPHFDFQGMFTQQRPHTTNTFENYAWLMVHYYL